MIPENAITEVSQLFSAMKAELGKAVRGQHHMIDTVLTAMLCGGHVLIEGVPGLGKTLLVNALSHITGGQFKRIQFTPDLMPSDIIGTTVYNMESQTFQVKKGPVFTDLLLADEINRAPAKTQSALLQAMQEKAVTIDGHDHPLGSNFMCLATQNPIELEGTFPLPEAQTDRFLVKVTVTYPSLQEENSILSLHLEGFSAEHPQEIGLKQIIDPQKLLEIKKVVRSVKVDESIIHYITAITSATRQSPGINLGVSPRGSVALLQTSQVTAAVSGRDYVIPDDVKEMALPVLRHRILLEPEAEIEGFTSDDYLKKVINNTRVPR
jgi:MoxR-like ATPase